MTRIRPFIAVTRLRLVPSHQATSIGADAQGIGDPSTSGTWSGEPRYLVASWVVLG